MIFCLITDSKSGEIADTNLNLICKFKRRNYGKISAFSKVISQQLSHD